MELFWCKWDAQQLHTALELDLTIWLRLSMVCIGTRHVQRGSPHEKVFIIMTLSADPSAGRYCALRKFGCDCFLASCGGVHSECNLFELSLQTLPSARWKCFSTLSTVIYLDSLNWISGKSKWHINKWHLNQRRANQIISIEFRYRHNVWGSYSWVCFHFTKEEKDQLPKLKDATVN